MRILPQSTAYVPVVAAAVAGVLGAVVTGPDAAVLGAILGYFVGKTVQSLVWTVNGAPGS